MPTCKTLLLDTSIIISLGDVTPTSAGEFFLWLEERSITPVICPVVSFEYRQSDKSVQDLKTKNSIMDRFLGSKEERFDLPFSGEYFEKARIIANIFCRVYKNFNPHGKTGDFLIGATVAHYQPQAGLWLATCNHRDFLPPLFTREEIYLLEDERRVYPIGFYSFSHQDFNQLAQPFLETTAPAVT